MRKQLIFIGILAFLVAVLGYYFLYVPEERTATTANSRLHYNNRNDNDTTPQEYSYTSLKLENPGFRFGAYNEETGRAGDFMFSQDIANEAGLVDERAFVEYGYKIDGRDGPKLLPEYIWQVPDDTAVISPIDGYVSKISIIDWSQDYSISLKNDENSPWMASLEHVQEPVVSVGDKVKVGQRLGRVSIVDFEGTGYGFAELSVWKGGATEKDIVKVCPYAAMTPEAQAQFSDDIRQFVREWEAFADRNTYNEEEWVLPGCLHTELTEYEAFNPQ